MIFQRRGLLQILSYAFGSSLILPRNEFAMAAQNPHSQRVMVCLRRQLANTNWEERRWKKSPESEGCSFEPMIRRL